MKNRLKKIILSLFPELQGQHVTKKAVVVAIADPIGAEGAASDDFRPYYAVDVRILREDGAIEEDTPPLESLRLPVPAAGDEAGLFGFPRPGSLVRVGYDYGSPAHPYIQNVLPDKRAIPPLQEGELLWQGDPFTYQKLDRQGAWSRVTSSQITDDSAKREIRAEENSERYGSTRKTTEADDTEEIGGSKTIEAIGATTLEAGADLSLISLGDTTVSAMGDLVEIVGQVRKSVATTVQQIQTTPGGKIWIGDSLINVLKLCSDTLSILSTVLTTLSTHSHPSHGSPPTQAGALTTYKSALDALKLSLDSITLLTPR